MKVAVVQMESRSDKAENVRRAVTLCRQAVRQGARWILLPEVFGYRGSFDLGKIRAQVAEPIPGESLAPLRALAQEHRVWILAGSVYEKIEGGSRVANTSVLIGSRGEIRARYRKQRLFRARLGRRALDEGRLFRAGRRGTVARVQGWTVGMSVCYDLRFPEIYQRYAGQGCDILTVPACFTYETGKAHWEILLRARAIENQCYVLAPNQAGTDSRGIKAFGHSLIVGPWGEVLARAPGEGESVLVAAMRKDSVKAVRRKLPLPRKEKSQ